jgi:hypothetical protein
VRARWGEYDFGDKESVVAGSGVFDERVLSGPSRYQKMVVQRVGTVENAQGTSAVSAAASGFAE